MLENYLSIQAPYYQEKFRAQGIILKDADSILKKQKWPAYTDIYDYPMPTSRNSMLFESKFKELKNTVVVGSVPTLFGNIKIRKLQ